MCNSLSVSDAVIAPCKRKCVCVCMHSCLLSFCHSVRPVWRSGTVMAWRWWTTCRKPSFCACQRWICTEPLILTSASLVRLAETDNPRQVTHTHTFSILPLYTNTKQSLCSYIIRHIAIVTCFLFFCPLHLHSLLFFLLSVISFCPVFLPRLD